MTRGEFMDQLEKLLYTLPVDEREEAMQYYRDYFEDAGEQNESQIIRELGSPKQIAATILADVAGDKGEYSETGYSDERFQRKESPATKESVRQEKKGYTYQNNTQENTQNSTYEKTAYQNNKENQESPKTSMGLKIVLVILICLFVVPVAAPILLGILATIIGLVFASFGLFIGLVVGSIAIMFVGIVLFVLGLTKLVVALPVALLTSGSGLLLFILGLLLTAATIKLCLIIYPAMCRLLISICRIPFHRKAVS